MKLINLPRYIYVPTGWQLMNYERGGKMVCRYFWPTQQSAGDGV